MNTPTNIFINTKVINNTNQKIYYSGEDEKIDINAKINSTFEYTNIVYNKRTLITTKDEKITKIIIAKDNNSLITNMHEIIPLENIIDIKVLD